MNKKKLALTLLLSSVSFVAVAAEASKVEAPKVEAPKVEAPKVEAPKVEAPKVEDAADKSKKDVQLSPETPATPGYLANAWAAVKDNQVMTAALVTSCVLLGAVVHAAVASQEPLNDEDAE